MSGQRSFVDFAGTILPSGKQLSWTVAVQGGDSAFSGRSDKASEVLLLVLPDSTKCHCQHHHEGQSATEPHFVESTDEMAFEPEGNIEAAIDSFGGGPFFVFP